jgi:hypothetical protein
MKPLEVSNTSKGKLITQLSYLMMASWTETYCKIKQKEEASKPSRF